MGKYTNLFIGTIVGIFVVVFVSVFVYLMITVPVPMSDNAEKDQAVKRELPESCNGVLGTNPALYPTAETCMTILYMDLYAPCNDGSLSQSESETCMDKLDHALDQNCKTEEKALGISHDECILDSLKRVYQHSP